MLRPVRTLFALLALLAALPPVSRGMLVVCAGDDGHLAVEVASEARACSGAPAPLTFHDHCSCNDGCGPCRDTRIETAPLTARPIGAAVALAPPPAMAAPWPSASLGARPVLACDPLAATAPGIHRTPVRDRTLLRI